MQLMHAIAAANNAEFYGLVQPIGSLAKHKNKVVELYGKIAALPNELPFVRDATSILDGYDDVFAEGGDPPVHLTQKGDRIVAEYVFRSIEPSITKILASAPDQ